MQSLYNNEPKVSIFVGDVLNEYQLNEAVSGVDVIFHAASFPYQEWEEKHVKCIDLLIQIASKHHAKLALVDNIYAYGRQKENPVLENALKNPHTKKGKIRLEMEKRLMNSEVPSLIVHLPDLYGPNANTTIFSGVLQSVVQRKNAYFVGDMTLPREYIHTFDAAKAMVDLALREDTFNQNWNIPSTHPITGQELLSLIREIDGYEKNFKSVKRGMIRFLSIFSPFMRELLEMIYLTEEPLLLSGDKYEKAVGPLPKTPYQEGLKETIQWMKTHE